jgi:hypothetical protein
MELCAAFSCFTNINHDIFSMFKSSALGSNIQLMRVERNHVPHGND